MTLRHHGALLSNTLLISTTSVGAQGVGSDAQPLTGMAVLIVGIVGSNFQSVFVRLDFLWCEPITGINDSWEHSLDDTHCTLTLPQHGRLDSLVKSRSDQVVYILQTYVIYTFCSLAMSLLGPFIIVMGVRVNWLIYIFVWSHFLIHENKTISS